MPHFVLNIPTEEEIEFQIAVVDEPAIESNFMVFAKEGPQQLAFKEMDAAQNLLMGYFMIADMKIPRRDDRGTYTVSFPKESIDKIVRNFSRNGLNGNMNEMHQSGKLLDGVFVLHHWQINKEMGLMAPKGFETEDNGSWFGIVRCENKDIYQKALAGELRGFSIEGLFIEDQIFKRIADEYFSFLDNAAQQYETTSL
jgi:hypothetical protein